MDNGWFGRLLMKISPHNEDTMEHNTEMLKEKIAARERARAEAQKKSRDFVDMQLQIMRRD